MYAPWLLYHVWNHGGPLHLSMPSSEPRSWNTCPSPQVQLLTSAGPVAMNVPIETIESIRSEQVGRGIPRLAHTGHGASTCFRGSTVQGGACQLLAMSIVRVTVSGFNTSSSPATLPTTQAPLHSNGWPSDGSNSRSSSGGRSTCGRSGGSSSWHSLVPAPKEHAASAYWPRHQRAARPARRLSAMRRWQPP